jgi:hypothetical protein
MTNVKAKAAADWLGSVRTNVMAWWLPTCAMLAGLFVATPAVIWIGALAWMGTACILNARLRADALSIYGTVLSRHDSSGVRVWRGHRPVRLLRMACARSRHSSRKQGHLVGDGARMGEVLLR